MRFLVAVLLALALDAHALEEVPYVPTPQAVVDAILKLGQVHKGDYLIDLGSGDGRIVITAAKQFGARGFGVELDPRLVQFSNKLAHDQGVADRVKFYQKDLFETDLSPASVLTMYLLPDVNLELRPRLLDRLKPGTRVVSHDFDMGEWRPDESLTIPAPGKSVGPYQQSSLYLWIVPAKAEGKWLGHLGAREVVLELSQRYQDVEGTAIVDGRPAKLGAVNLRGDRLHFTLDDGNAAIQVSAEVKGSRMEGSSPAGTWRAKRER